LQSDLWPHTLRYFPTLLIVLLAVFNDGAMIALSRDRVRPSQFPTHWSLPVVFFKGALFGLYLTLTSWILFHVRALPHKALFVLCMKYFDMHRPASISGCARLACRLFARCQLRIRLKGFESWFLPASSTHPERNLKGRLRVCIGRRVHIIGLVATGPNPHLQVAGHSDFFPNTFGLQSLYYANAGSECAANLATQYPSVNPDSNVCNISPYQGAIDCSEGITLLQQCTAELSWSRASQLRSLIYANVRTCC
jgi:hypothetical protein